MPPGLIRALLSRRGATPAAVSFAEWAASQFGENAAAVAAAAGVAVFHADPGELSAAFVWERLRRALAIPPAARFRVGGWAGLLPVLGEDAARSGS